MKHFVVTLHYVQPLEIIDQYLIEHRAFLDEGYEKEILLVSGPQNPREGGILIARGDTLEEVKDFCKKDPFFINQCAEYTYVEFIPVKYQKNFRSWFLPGS